MLMFTFARKRLPLLCTLLIAGLGAMLGAGSAKAAFGFQEFTTTLSTMQAGAHPDLTTTLVMNTRPDDILGEVVDEHVKDVRVELPRGFVGDPEAVPKCKISLFHLNKCPSTTQIGLAVNDFLIFGSPLIWPSPIFNLEPGPGRPAEFGFFVIASPVHMLASVRTGQDYGITTSLRDVTQFIPLRKTTVTFWGVPGDAAHDAERYESYAPGAAFRGVKRAFLTNPSVCGQQLTTRAAISSWAAPDSWSTASSTTPDVITGCDQATFEPSLSVTAGSRRPSTPTGLDVDVAVPQTDSPDAYATPPLREAVVTLPKGFAISPAAAQGLGACAPEQIDLGSAAPPSCPEDSRVGTVEIETPIVDQPLTGRIYLAQQGANPFSSTFAIYVDAEARGARIKLAGKIAPDPQTGQLTATFHDAPQQPFSHFRLHFAGGPRAVLVTPPECGTHTTTGQLTSWARDTPVAVDAQTLIDEGCAAHEFAPGFHAGSATSKAGALTAVSVAFSRDDAQQRLGGIDVALPPGLLGEVGSVPLCAEAQAAAGTCTEASRVGRVTSTSGAGPLPLELLGRAYLTGPYKGAPFGLSLVVPAIAGPFDLGTIVVRAGIAVDPRTAALRIVSDALPTMIAGVPLDLRSVQVAIDRPGFMFNPTSCAPTAVSATVTAVGGAQAQVTTPFSATDCAALPYAPKLSMALTGKGSTKAGGHPTLTAHLAPRAGDANSRRVSVALPAGVGFDVKSAPGLCEPEQAEQRRCPAASKVGQARVVSILPYPLEGPVHLTRGARGALPKLTIPLSAGGVTIDLTATTAVEDGRLVTTFDDLPDVPFSAFDLTIEGGSRGILVAGDAGLCSETQTVRAEMDGQNGKARDAESVVRTACSLAVVGRGWSRTALELRVGGLRKGTMTVSGRGLATAHRTIAGASTTTVRTPLSRAVRSTVAARGSARLRVRVRFVPADGGKAKATTATVTVRRTPKALAPSTARFRSMP